MDTIYLIQNKRSPDQYKIGITGNWAQRSRQLEVGTKTTCITTARVNDPRSLEKHLHHKFDADRLPQSEWFHLSSSQLLFVQSAFRKAESDCQVAVPAGVVAVDELLQQRRQEDARRHEAMRAAAAAAKKEQDALDAARREALRASQEEQKRRNEARSWAEDPAKASLFLAATRRGILKWFMWTMGLFLLTSAVHRKPITFDQNVAPPLLISLTWGALISAGAAASKIKE